MSELVSTGYGMYEEVEVVNNLNKVKGFDPRKYMRLISNEGQQSKYYLDVAFRKLWFRLCFPEGKIVKKLIKLTDNVAIVEARVYLNRNDAEDNFISNALAQKYQSGDEQFGNKFVELAETAAVGRALSDAGFGLQFADTEGDMDPEITEAPIAGLVMNGANPLPAGTYMEDASLENQMMQEPEEVPFENVSIPGQYGIEEYIPTPAQVGAAMRQTPVPQQTGIPAMMQTAPIQNRSQQFPAMQQSSNAAVPLATGTREIRKDMPVDEIMQLLTRDTAAAVVVSAGYYKGKTLGQIAVEKPESLEWYVKSYGGADNLLRAAAKFLMEKAYAKAG